jgi:hypothetical protein
MAMDAKQVQG